jgi:hypothetical protein
MDYMNWVNQLEGAASPYRDPQVYTDATITATFDDIEFGGGRQLDEWRSAERAKRSMEAWPFAFSQNSIQGIYTSILSSVFNEKEGTQAFDPDAGHIPLQTASLVGDLWILFLDARPQHAMRLVIENMYKADTAHEFHQILLHKAMRQNFVGKNIFDFLKFIGADDELRQAYGQGVHDTAAFGDAGGIFKFPDARLEADPIKNEARRENARTLRELGTSIMQGKRSPLGAYRFAAGRIFSEFAWGSAAHAQPPVMVGRDRLYPVGTRLYQEAQEGSDVWLA